MTGLPLLQKLKKRAREIGWVHRTHRRAVRGIRFVRDIPPADLRHPRKLAIALRVHPHTMLHYPRVAVLHDLALAIEAERVDGSYVECGVAHGGSSALVGSILRKSGRRLWLFDSWEGLPEPGEDDVSMQGKLGYKGMDRADMAKTRELLFEKFDLPEDRVTMVKGWFQDTLPRHRDAAAPIALLHLDGDWYESIMFCLVTLFDAVTPGGYVVVDDYSYWKGCKKAVDEFLFSRALPVELVDVGGVSAYFRKPAG